MICHDFFMIQTLNTLYKTLPVPQILLLAVFHFHSCIMLVKLKLISESMLIFWSTGETGKKSRAGQLEKQK